MSAESQQKVKEKLPMGDLFEKRKIQPPIMSPSQMAIGIHDQVLLFDGLINIRFWPNEKKMNDQQRRMLWRTDSSVKNLRKSNDVYIYL